MQQLPLLIRLKHDEVERLSSERAALERTLGELRVALGGLEQEWLQEEQFVSQHDPDMMTFEVLDHYRSMNIAKKEALLAEISETTLYLEKKMEDLQEAFADLKRYEYIEQEQLTKAAKEALLAETKLLDEIGGQLSRDE